MRRLLLFAVIVCLPLILSAQIQQGYVKTRQWLILVRGTCKDLYGAVSTEERL